MPVPERSLFVRAHWSPASPSLHTTGRLVIEGTATVSEDGLFVRTDPGTGITHPGWHGLTPPGSTADGPPGPPDPSNNDDCPNPPCRQCPDNPRDIQKAMARCQWDGGINGVVPCVTLWQTCVAVCDKQPLPLKALCEKLCDAELDRCKQKMKDAMDCFKFYENCLLHFGDPETGGQFQPEVPRAPNNQVAVPELDNAIIEFESEIERLLMYFDLHQQMFVVIGSATNAAQLTGAQISQLQVLSQQLSELLGFEDSSAALVPILQRLDDLIEYLGSRFDLYPHEAAFYSLEDMTTGFTLRGRTEMGGAISGIFISPNTQYRLRKFFPTTLTFSEVVFTSAASGLRTEIPRGGSSASQSGDADSDGLSDVLEFVLGTDPQNRDSDSDGIGDLAEVQQGLDPLSGRAFPTGVIASMPLPGEAKEVVLEGSTLDAQQVTAYMALGTRGVGVVNVSQFRMPILLSQLDLPGDVTDVAVDSNLRTAVVAANAGGLHFLNVADPLAPVLQQTLNIVATEVETVEGVAYVAAGPHLLAYDIANRERLQTLPLGTTNLTRLAREGTFIYTMDSSSLLRAIDISGPNLVPRGSLMMPVGGKLFVGGGIAFVGSPGRVGGFATADVSNPGVLRLISGVDDVRIEGSAIAANGSGLAFAVGSVVGPMGLIRALDVLDVSNPTNTDRLLTRFNLPDDPFSVTIAAGIAFVADGTAGLQVVNYAPFDNRGTAPTVAITTLPSDLNPNAPGIQMQEGSMIRVTAGKSDDVQVRNVELLFNGQAVRNDVSFPFDLSAIAPVLAGGATNVELRVRATDTSGNVGLSAPVLLELVSDTFPPALVSIDPPNGAIRGQRFHAITLRFSEPIDPVSISAATVLLSGPSGTIAPQDIFFPNNGTSAQLTYPVLAPGIYLVSIDATTIRDRAGNTFGLSNVISSFEIRQAFAVWTSPASGFWDDPFNWAGTLPTTNDDVLIDVPEDVLVTYRQGTTILRSLRTKNRMVMSGGTLVVSNVFEVGAALTMSGGTLRNATVIAGPNPPSITFIGNVTLDQVRLDANTTAGTVTASAALNVVNSFTLNGTLTMVSAGGPNVLKAVVRFSGGQQSLTGSGQVVFNGPGGFDDGAIEPWANGQLTIGPGITIRSGNRGGKVGNSDFVLTNRGTILSTAAGWKVEVTGSSMRNEGTLQAAGGILDVNGLTGAVGKASATAAGHLDLDGSYVNDQNLLVLGATLTLRGNWANAGTINMTNGTVNFDSTFQLADVGSLNRSGGTANITGTLDDPGATLALNSGTGDWRLQGGRIKGVVVSATGGARLVIVAPGGFEPTLDGVRLEGEAVLGEGTLSVLNGLTLSNGILTVVSGVIAFNGGTQTLSGSGQVVLLAENGSIQSRFSQLTVASGITIRNEGIARSGNSVGHFSGVLINQGTIVSRVRTVTLAGSAVRNEGMLRAEAPMFVDTQSFTNSGTVAAISGTVSLSGLVGNSGTFIVGTNAIIRIMGDLPQAAGSAIDVHLAGTGLGHFGRIEVTGNVNLRGILNVVRVNNHTPAFGDRFRFMTFGARAGIFETTNGTEIGGGLIFSLDTTDPMDLELVVTNQ